MAGFQVPPAWPGRAVAPPNHKPLGSDGPKARVAAGPLMRCQASVNPSCHSPAPQKFSLLGSTGSIGTQTLDIVAEHPDKFQVVALSAGGNLELLVQQVKQFRPKMVSVRDPAKLPELREALAGLDYKPELLAGEEGIVEVAR